MALIDNHDPLMASFSGYYPKEGLKYSTYDFLEYNPKVPGDGKMTVFFYSNWIYHIQIGGFYVSAIAKLILILFFLDFPKTGKQISQKQYKIGQAAAFFGFSTSFFSYQVFLIFFLNYTNIFIWELFPDWEFIDTYDCENKDSKKQNNQKWEKGLNLSEDTDKLQENKYNTPIIQSEIKQKGKRSIANFILLTSWGWIALTVVLLNDKIPRHKFRYQLQGNLKQLGYQDYFMLFCCHIYNQGEFENGQSFFYWVHYSQRYLSQNLRIYIRRKTEKEAR
eukprot:403356419